MHHRSFEGSAWRVRALAFVAVSSLVVGRPASADMIVPPPPDCVGQPAGARCVRFNGTAGRCIHTPDSRRPGQVSIACEADPDECATLAVGAACHGYLGRIAHCREFNDPQTHRTWRSCVADENQPTAPPAPTPSPSPAPAPTAPRATTPPSRSSGCSVAPGAQGADRALGLYAALALAVVARRRRSLG